jgi:hypothetical protein
MRRIAALFILLSLTRSLPAQPKPQLIKWPEVEVRSGPSDKFPSTGVLRKNAQVFVKGPPVNGYLEIMPPPGSVSWVPKAVVTKLGNPANGRQMFSITGESKDDPVPIHPGGPNIADGPLNVDLTATAKSTAKRGTIGYIRGNPIKPAWDDKQWYPIDPLPGESRFISAKALEEPSAADIAAEKERKSGTNGTLTSTPGKNAEEKFQLARKADRAGRIQEAIELYQEVNREVSATNDALANYCATRIWELKNRRNTANGQLTSRGNAANSDGAPPLPSGEGTGFNPARLGPSGSNTNPPKNLRSTGAGTLRRAGFSIDNKPTYALLARNGFVAFYVTPEPGINLEQFVERLVDLQGIVEVRGDVRGGEYMRVSGVYVLR